MLLQQSAEDIVLLLEIDIKNNQKEIIHHLKNLQPSLHKSLSDKKEEYLIVDSVHISNELLEKMESQVVLITLYLKITSVLNNPRKILRNKEKFIEELTALVTKAIKIYEVTEAFEMCSLLQNFTAIIVKREARLQLHLLR